MVKIDSKGIYALKIHILLFAYWTAAYRVFHTNAKNLIIHIWLIWNPERNDSFCSITIDTPLMANQNNFRLSPLGECRISKENEMNQFRIILFHVWCNRYFRKPKWNVIKL